MNFKDWLVINEVGRPQLDCKPLIDDIANFYSLNGSYPRSGSFLGTKLSKLRTKYSNNKLSQQCINYGISKKLPDNWYKPSRPQQQSIQKDCSPSDKEAIDDIANFYSLNSSYPPIWRGPPAGVNLSKLRTKYSNNKLSQQCINYGISKKLPDEPCPWYKPQTPECMQQYLTEKRIKEIKEQIDLIYEYYINNNNRFPPRNTIEGKNLLNLQITAGPNDPRRTTQRNPRQDSIAKIVEDYGKEKGLPDYWLSRNTCLGINEAQERINKIYLYYKDKKVLPNVEQNSKAGPGRWLSNLQLAYSRTQEGDEKVPYFWHESLANYGISIGLPQNWWISPGKRKKLKRTEPWSVGEKDLSEIILNVIKGTKYKMTGGGVKCNKEDKGCYYYDNAITDDNNNIVAVFEYQGGQHYYPINRWGGIWALQKQIINDKKKLYLTNFPILIIPYWEHEEMIKWITKFWSDIQNNGFTQPVWAKKLAEPKGVILDNINKYIKKYIQRHPTDPYVSDPNLITDEEIKSKVIRFKAEIEAENGK